MCGIVGIFKIKQQTQELRQKALKMSQKLRHRGPDSVSYTHLTLPTNSRV